MTHSAVPADTDPEAFAMLTSRWRTMTIADRAALINQLCVDVEKLARIDIANHDPRLTELEICHELARRRYGAELADAAYTGVRTR